MKKRYSKYFIFFLAALVLSPSVSLAARAGIVVRKSDGQTKTACVSFDSDYISGWELLEKSGFNPVSKNGFVVAIDGEGNKDSSQLGRGDNFWSYWKRNSGWVFQSIGATYDRVRNGDVEGWEFGDGSCHLDSFSFDQICSSSEADTSSTEEDGSQDVKTFSVSADTSVTPAASSTSSSPADENTGSIGISASSSPAAAASLESQVAVDSENDSADINQSQTKNILPAFSLKNVISLFAFFIVLGVAFLLIKIRASKRTPRGR